MTDIHFYHLTRSTLEQVLPELLEKTLARGWRAVVLTESTERAENLCQQLWSYRADSFLPHGAAKDGNAARHPIWLTAVDERPNAADILFLLDGTDSSNLAAYQRVCLLFADDATAAVTAARARWKLYQTTDHTLTYWQQTDQGWEKTA
jgi:DNA polymerase III subunit chi